MLKPEICEIIISVLNEERANTLRIVSHIIEAEQNYIFTNDLEFKENKMEDEPPVPGQQPGQPPPQGRPAPKMNRQ